MDFFEKQQTIEAIRNIIKARWFYVLLIFAQGIAVKFLFGNRVPLANSAILSLIVIGEFVFNFGYWIYLRRPPEKIGSRQLQIIKVLQVIIDQLSISAVLCFSGTTGKQIVLLYFIPLIFATSLYKKKGVILAALSRDFPFLRFVCSGIFWDN